VRTGYAKLLADTGLRQNILFIPLVRCGWRFSDEPALLASCYQKSLSLAKEKKIKPWLFRNFTGVYRFPKELAAMIAVNETKKFLDIKQLPRESHLVTYDDDNYEIYRKILDL